MSTLRVDSSSGSYDIYIENGALARLEEIVDTRAVVVVDTKVWSIWSSSIEATLDATHIEYHIVTIDGGETNKNIDNVLYMYAEFNRYGITKSDYIVCIGGGVLGDMTAFAAATYLRGVGIVQVPTTLLAMVDSSVGGKSAIDMPFGKNLVGIIKSPCLVLIDTSYLSSLDERQFSTGISEIIKSGLIRDNRILDELERDDIDVTRLIELSLAVKADVVMRDEYESGERMILNFGHTIAHAVEALGGYERYTHGEAVAIGMDIALRLSIRLCAMDDSILDRARHIMTKYNLPLDTDYSVDDMIEYIARDKKSRGSIINYVLLERVGEPTIMPIEIDRLAGLLEEIM